MAESSTSSFPDLSLLCDKALALIADSSSAQVRPQFPGREFDLSSTEPTVVVSIKKVSIHNCYSTAGPMPLEATLGIGIYVPKSLDSALCYKLFSEVSALLLQGQLGIESVSCEPLEYVSELRHYRLAVTAVAAPKNICEEEEDGDTDL